MADWQLEGSTALVTGAGTGIGAATAHRLAARGCRVICAGRRLDRVQAVAQKLGERGLALALDVQDAAAVAGLLARLPPAWRGVDVLVNSAGHDVGGRQPFVDGDPARWTDTIDTNVNGVIRVTHALLPGMLARDSGHIVNIGSTAAFKPYAGGSAYVASKYAVHGLSECLGLDCRDTGVRVSEVLPGLVRTDFATTRWGDAARAESFYGASKDGALDPDDVARAVIYVLDQPPGVVVSQLVVMPSGKR